MVMQYTNVEGIIVLTIIIFSTKDRCLFIQISAVFFFSFFRIGACRYLMDLCLYGCLECLLNCYNRSEFGRDVPFCAYSQHQ